MYYRYINETLTLAMKEVDDNSSRVNFPKDSAKGKFDKPVIMTKETLAYFLMINFWGPGQCVAVLGLVVNILNVIVFIKQGVRDSVNISLLGLTISDLGSLVFLILLNLCWTPPVAKLDLPFYPQQIMYFLFWGHVVFTRVTTGTTAWITFERCLCIVSPLKNKSQITPRRTVTFIAALYVIMLSSIAPMFYTSKFIWIFDARKNKTLLGYIKITERSNVDDIVYVVNNILPILFFIFVVICTTILVRKLQSSARWRHKLSSSKNTVISKRDTKVVKMVLIISIVFIICYAPGAIFFIWPLANPEMKIAGAERNFVIAVFSLMLHMEGINAAANFFVYIRMSSKFKATFQRLICAHFVKRSQLQGR